MREVAKSMFGFGAAVSLFGLQQMSKLLTRSADQASAVTEFENLSLAVQAHLSEAAAQQFRAADQWQRRVVDTLFDAGALQSFDPRRAVEALDPRPMMKSGVEFVQQSVNRTQEVQNA